VLDIATYFIILSYSHI